MNANTRTLRLRREVLTALAGDELEAVVGAAAGSVLSQYFVYCVTDPVQSKLFQCPTPPETMHC